MLGKNLAAILLLGGPALAAPSHSWNKIRYQGGTIEAKVNPFDWNTTLRLSADQLELDFAGRKSVSIPVEDIVAVSYGERAYRRVADMAVLSVFLTPIALFGLLHKSKDHIVSIEFFDEKKERGAVLLTVHKDHVGTLLSSLRLATRRQIENWP